MAWTDEEKQTVIAAYKAADPTPETSTEIIKDIAEETGQSPNGIRMVLVQAGVYVKKEATAGTKSTSTKADGDKSPRVSKEDQINTLKAAINAAGAEANDEILDKLTGKAAAYFTEVIRGIGKVA
jgi:hypothetical protein